MIAPISPPVTVPETVPSAPELCATRHIESLLLAAARAWPSKTALVDGTIAVPYGDLSHYVIGFAHELTGSGVLPGDRVAIWLDKTIESVVALFGAWVSGAVVVSVNEGLRSRQIAHILDHSGATFLVSTPRKLSRVDGDCYREVTVIEPALRPSSRPLGRPSCSADPAEPAIILYTSGSTGRPKGILVSHANLLAGARIVTRYLGLQHDERILSVLPFSFDYGLNQLLTTVGVGATLVLTRSHFPAEICRVMADQEITGCAGVPPFWIQLISGHSPLATMRFPRLRYITNSGGTFPVALVKQYRRLLPHTRIFLMYGLSEAFRSTYLPPDQIGTRPDSMGKAIPETELFVVNEDGGESRPGETGELVHRGPTVALGYWNDPEATSRVFRPDTLPGGNPDQRVVFSGDLVRKDEEGFFYFVGRRDKMIKSQGYRISPEEVEEVLLSCPLVSEAAVCGRPDQERGAAIVAHVVPADLRSFDAQALVSFCQQEMPTYMQPRDIVVHESLPRTASGKIDRQSLQ